jgi:hypothetical protein
LPPDDAWLDLKRKATLAWKQARSHAAVPRGMADAIWSDTLLLAHNQTPHARRVMFGETLQLFTLINARRRWLHPPGETESPAPQPKRYLGPYARRPG